MGSGRSPRSTSACPVGRRPAHLFGVLAGYLRLTTRPPHPDRRFAQGADDAAAMVRDLVGRARRRGRVRARRDRGSFCGVPGALIGLREMPKFLHDHRLRTARNALPEIGEELAAAGPQ